MPDKVSIDPRIHFVKIGDGEIHIVVDMDEYTLVEMARGFMHWQEGSIEPADSKIVFRIKSQDAIDFIIQKLEELR